MVTPLCNHAVMTMVNYKVLSNDEAAEIHLQPIHLTGREDTLPPGISASDNRVTGHGVTHQSALRTPGSRDDLVKRTLGQIK